MRALDGSYSVAAAAATTGTTVSKPVGRFAAALPPHMLPSFAKASRWRLDANALVLSSNLGLAYIAHYNAPAFYKSLKARSTARFRGVCAASFGILSLLYLGMMLMGYRTFASERASVARPASAGVTRTVAMPSPDEPLAYASSAKTSVFSS